VFFDTPAAVCRERNRNRDRVVPESAIEIMAARLQAPSVNEGLESVTVYRVPDYLAK
jgi:predicted kinase